MIQIVINDESAKKYGLKKIMAGPLLPGRVRFNSVYEKDGEIYTEGQWFMAKDEKALQEFFGPIEINKPIILEDSLFEI